MNKIIVFTFICSTVALVHASEKRNYIEPSNKVGIFSDVNQRNRYEDRSFYTTIKGGDLNGSELYAVYDGHFCHRINNLDDDNDGSVIAQFLVDRFPDYLRKTSGTIQERMVAACKNIDNDKFVKKHKDCGATAAIVLITKNNNKRVACCAHVGDPRIVLEKNGKVDFATNDQVPTRADEYIRIKAKGIVFNNRVNGFLSVSRAFGDYVLDSDKKIILVEPDYKEIELTSEHTFLILATNGLWRMVSNEEAVSILNAKRESVKDLNELAQMVGMFAKTRNSNDNITVVLVNLSST